MITNADWKPSLAWHARFLGVILAVCVMAFAAFCYITAKLPAPYQPHHPAPQAMPWQNNSSEEL